MIELPFAGILATLSLFYAATGTLVYWLAFRSPARAFAVKLNGVVAPFFAAVSVLFALLTGFLASDVGDRNRQAVRAVTAERDAVLNLYTLSIASASEMGSIRAALRAYVAAVVEDEWSRMAASESSQRTDEAMAVLMQEVSDPKIAVESGQAVHNALLNTAIRIRTARSERLALSADRTNDLKWATVLILGVLTQVAIGLVHLDRPRAHAAAMTVFSLAMTITLSLIALQEHPFNGPLRVMSTPIEEALAKMSTGDAP